MQARRTVVICQHCANCCTAGCGPYHSTSTAVEAQKGVTKQNKNKKTGTTYDVLMYVQYNIRTAVHTAVCVHKNRIPKRETPKRRPRAQPLLISFHQASCGWYLWGQRTDALLTTTDYRNGYSYWHLVPGIPVPAVHGDTGNGTIQTPLSLSALLCSALLCSALHGKFVGFREIIPEKSPKMLDIKDIYVRYDR